MKSHGYGEPLLAGTRLKRERPAGFDGLWRAPRAAPAAVVTRRRARGRRTFGLEIKALDSAGARDGGPWVHLIFGRRSVRLRSLTDVGCRVPHTMPCGKAADRVRFKAGAKNQQRAVGSTLVFGALLAAAYTVSASEDVAATRAEAPQAGANYLAGLDQIVIDAHREKLSQLRKEIEQSEVAFYEAFNKINTEPEYETHCLVETSTATPFQAQVCEPRFVQDAIQGGPGGGATLIYTGGGIYAASGEALWACRQAWFSMQRCRHTSNTSWSSSSRTPRCARRCATMTP